jgi:hypothetical protein
VTTKTALASQHSTTGPIDMFNKKFLFSIINSNKSADSQMTNVDKLWKAIMMAPDSETMKKGKPLIENKNHMVQILKTLADETLIMYVPEDGNVVML